MEQNNFENKTNKNTEVQNSKELISRFKRLSKIIINFILLVLIAIILLIIIRVLIFKKSDIFGYKFYIIKSGSMEPTIEVLDAVITKYSQDIKLGDIIAINDSNNVVIHRVVESNTQDGETIYKTKGDNNNTIDKGDIKTSEIDGKVVLIVPKIGKAIVFMKSHLIIFVYIIAIIIIVALIRRLI